MHGDRAVSIGLEHGTQIYFGFQIGIADRECAHEPHRGGIHHFLVEKQASNTAYQWALRKPH
jgi:hypothetical protein